MSGIDTGTGLHFEQDYPISGINQSSQQFRDNNYVVKLAIENLQIANSISTTNVIAVRMVQNLTTGQMSLEAAYRNNTLVLPLDSGSTIAGSVRYSTTNKTIDVYTGTGWRSAIQTDENSTNVTLANATVNTRLTLNYTPSNATDAITVSYFQTNLAAALAGINANSSATSNAIAAEAALRLANDNALSNAISNVTLTVNQNTSNISNNTTDITNLKLSVQQNANAILALGNSTNAAVFILTNNLANTNLAVDALADQINDLAVEANQEKVERIANDALLAQSIANVVSNVALVNSALQAETLARIAGDLTNANAIANNASLIVTERAERIANDALLQSQIDGLGNGLAHNFHTNVDPIIEQVSDEPTGLGAWNSATTYAIDDYVYKNGRAFRAVDVSTNLDPNDPANSDFWYDDTRATDGDFWINPDFGNALKVYTVAYDGNLPPNITGATWEIVILDGYLSTANGGTVAGPTEFTDNVAISNSTLTLLNSTFELPGSNVIIDAGHALLIQKIPNSTGAGDGGFVTFDQNNFDYALPTPAVANAIANSIIANGIANTNAMYEFSVLRIGTTNDNANGVNDDSMALEPSAHLFLNPGWSGAGYGSGTRVSSPANAMVIVGNATSNSVTIRRDTGDINTKGNIVAVGDISGLSDASLKENVTTISNALDKVDALRGVMFTRNDLPGNPEQIGFLAQEVRPVVPQVVTALPNGKLALAYGNMSALLVEAIKELRRDVNVIKTHLGI